MYCTCIFKQGSLASAGIWLWQYRLYENLYLEKASPSKLILCQLYSIINKTSQCASDFPASQYSLEKYLFSLFLCQLAGMIIYQWSHLLCWFSIQPRLWDWFLVMLLWLKSGNSWMCAEQACQGLMRAGRHSVCQQVVFHKQVEEGASIANWEAIWQLSDR